jgi:hypothetical protein
MAAGHGVSETLLRSCAHATFSFNDEHPALAEGTLSISLEFPQGTDTDRFQAGTSAIRRCVFEETFQEACVIDGIQVPEHANLKLVARMHHGAHMSWRPDKTKLPDVSAKVPLDITSSVTVAMANAEFSISQLKWGVEDREGGSISSRAPPLKTSFRAVVELDKFSTSYACDASLSCHFKNVVLGAEGVGANSQDSEGRTLWIYGDDEQQQPCSQMPLTTSVHKRFVTKIGWRKGEKPAIRMASAGTKESGTPDIGAANSGQNALTLSASQCVENPTILFNIQFATYYYHAVAEGAIPLAHSILHGYHGRQDVQLVNLQRWGDFEALPEFLRTLLLSLSDVPPLSLEQLEDHVRRQKGRGASSHPPPLCFRELSTGFWPMLRNRRQFRAASNFLRQRILSHKMPASQTRWAGAPIQPMPPAAWQLGTLAILPASAIPPISPPLAVFIQREKIVNLNFAGQEKDDQLLPGATRVILNIKALENIARGLGYATKVVDSAQMTLRAQVDMMQQADVFTAVFGSGWSNAVWMRRAEGTTAIMLLGWGFKHGCDYQMLQPVRLLADQCRSKPETLQTEWEREGEEEAETIAFTGGQTRGTKYYYNDHCDAILHEFPSLVDPITRYVEIAATRPAQFQPSFNLRDAVCRHDIQRLQKEYGAGPDAFARCVAAQDIAQEKAIVNPAWAWENLGIDTAHLFFLNANLWVDPITYERAILHSATHQDRASDSVATCWVGINPASDPLVRVVGRAALSLLKNTDGKRTYTVHSARVRFAVLGPRDMRMYVQLECTEDAGGNTFFALGVVSLEATVVASAGIGGTLPLWFPILLDHTREASSLRWVGGEGHRHRRHNSDDAHDNCVVEEGGLVSAFQRAYDAQTMRGGRLALRQLGVRLKTLSNMARTMTAPGDGRFRTFHGDMRWKMDQSRVVMGVAVGYGMDEFRRFVGSLRATGYKGSIILGVSVDLSERCRNYLLLHNVVTRTVPRDILTPARDGDGENAGFYGIAVPRWRLYETWIKEAEGWHAHDGDGGQSLLFLLTDTRDVYFQRDPFEDIENDVHSGGGGGRQLYDLYLFEEWTNMTIGTCKHNSDWVHSCWGPAMQQRLAPHPIICSGTVMGTGLGITRLIRALVDEVAFVRELHASSSARARLSIPPNSTAKHGRPCVNDQAYVNVILRGGAGNKAALMGSMKQRVKIFKQGFGPVNTIGWLSVGSQVPRDVDGFVLNVDGRRSAVVHQYDRDSDVQQWVDARFVHVLDVVEEVWEAGAKYAAALQSVLVGIS